MSRNQKEKLENYLITVGPRKKYEYFHSDEKKILWVRSNLYFNHFLLQGSLICTCTSFSKPFH